MHKRFIIIKVLYPRINNTRSLHFNYFYLLSATSTEYKNVQNTNIPIIEIRK